MNLLADIKGQNNAVRFLSGSLSSGRIANAYLFSGPEGVGKALAARLFLMELMRTSSVEHPDILWIKPEKSIKIEQIRQAREKLSLKPYEKPYSACVIEDAHLMTLEGANALLKVLEEPPGKSLLILITSKKELLLPTIVSRCASVPFQPLALDDAAQIVSRSAGVSAEEALFLSRFSGGSPGRALEMIKSDIPGRMREIFSILSGVDRKNAGSADWDTEDKDSLTRDIELILMIARDAASGKKAPGIFGEMDIDGIYNAVERLIDLKKALEGNVNPKLVAPLLVREIVRS